MQLREDNWAHGSEAWQNAMVAPLHKEEEGGEGGWGVGGGRGGGGCERRADERQWAMSCMEGWECREFLVGCTC